MFKSYVWGLPLHTSLVMMSSGLITFPTDFDILAPSPSRTNPWVITALKRAQGGLVEPAAHIQVQRQAETLQGVLCATWYYCTVLIYRYCTLYILCTHCTVYTVFIQYRYCCTVYVYITSIHEFPYAGAGGIFFIYVHHLANCQFSPSILDKHCQTLQDYGASLGNCPRGLLLQNFATAEKSSTSNQVWLPE